MSTVVGFLQTHATLVLFFCICLGYLIGAIPIGRVRLGGVCGTLLTTLIIGQVGVVVAPGASQVAFALFIFSLGYLAGPQFVASFRRQDLRLVLFPVIEMVVVIGMVLGATVALDLGPGTAAGLFAGGTSQSAALGTASEALNHIGLSQALVASEQQDLASAYSLCYLVGLMAIVIFSTQIAPAVMRVDLVADAAAVLRRLGPITEAARADVDLSGRLYRTSHDGPATVAALEQQLGPEVRVVAVVRDGVPEAFRRDLALNPGDSVQIVGRRGGLSTAAGSFVGAEVDLLPSLSSTAATVEVMITRTSLAKRQTEVQDLLDHRSEVMLVQTNRAGHPYAAQEVADLRPGDVMSLAGRTEAVRQAGSSLGRPIDATIHADWAYLAAGIVVGMLVGLIDLRWGPLDMTVGVGGGVLLAGLVFGWFRMRRSTIGAYAPVAAEVIKDLGLTIFVAVAGLTGAPRIASMVRELGVALPLAALLVSVVPATISLLVARRALKLPATLALGVVAGQQCSTPALTVLQQRAGNNAPLLTFVKVYAMSNVLLPLLAPLVVGAAMAISA